MEYDSAELERVAQRFWRDMWQSVTPDAVTESGVEMAGFGPVQATAFGDLPEIPILNQIRGAAEPEAIAGGHLAAAVEWMRAREVDYRVPVAESRPGAGAAEAWLSERGYERGEGWIKMVRAAAPLDLPANPGVTIYELGESEEDGEGLSSIAAETLELPVTAGTLFFSLPQTAQWRCYTAGLEPEGEIVATGSMLIDDGVAQLGPGHHARARPRARLQHGAAAPAPARRGRGRLPHRLRRTGRTRSRAADGGLPEPAPSGVRGGVQEPQLAAPGAASGRGLLRRRWVSR